MVIQKPKALTSSFRFQPAPVGRMSSPDIQVDQDPLSMSWDSSPSSVEHTQHHSTTASDENSSNDSGKFERSEGSVEVCKRPASPSILDNTEVPNAKRVKEGKTVQFSPNFILGQEPKVSDYDDTSRALCLRAIFAYEACILGVHPFPTSQIQTKAAQSSWRHANKAAEEDYGCNPCIISLVSCFMQSSQCWTFC